MNSVNLKENKYVYDKLNLEQIIRKRYHFLL